MLRSVLSPLAATVLAGLAPTQVLLMPNATTDMLMALSPIDGSVVNPGLFAIPNTTQVSAIDVAGDIWISEQTGDRVVRYSSTGAVLGTIGPTFPGGGFDNIRGMAFVNGLVHVTNSGTANGAPGEAIQVFDIAGNFVQTFTTASLAVSPFSILEHQGDLLVAGSSNNNDVYRFATGGAPISVFHNSATINFAHQLARASDGNVWCAGFTSGNVVKLDATTGAVITTFPGGSTRGVFELANGNVLWTNGTGAWVYDWTTQTSTQVVTGICYHVNLYGAGSATAGVAAYGVGCDGLALAANGAPQLGNAGFALLVNNVPAVSPLGFVAFGSTVVNPGLDLAFIGMPGCRAYQNLDVGLFSGSPTVGGTSTLALPIPNNPALAGAKLASQGVSLSIATPLGLAASNGLVLVVGN